MQFYYGAIYPIGVNDGEKGEQWIQNKQTDKRRLLEMPWPKGRHLKIRLQL